MPPKSPYKAAWKTRQSVSPSVDMPSLLADAEQRHDGYIIYGLLPEKTVIERTHAPIPTDLRAQLPSFISRFDALPKADRERYDLIVQQYDLKLEELYIAYFIGQWDQVQGWLQKAKVVPGKIGRPRRKSPLSRYIGAWALELRQQGIAWADMADLMLGNLVAIPHRDSLQEALFQRLTLLKNTKERTYIGTYIQGFATRHKEDQKS